MICILFYFFSAFFSLHFVSLYNVTFAGAVSITTELCAVWNEYLAVIESCSSSTHTGTCTKYACFCIQTQRRIFATLNVTHGQYTMYGQTKREKIFICFWHRSHVLGEFTLFVLRHHMTLNDISDIYRKMFEINAGSDPLLCLYLFVDSELPHMSDGYWTRRAVADKICLRNRVRRQRKKKSSKP